MAPLAGAAVSGRWRGAPQRNDRCEARPRPRHGQCPQVLDRQLGVPPRHHGLTWEKLLSSRVAVTFAPTAAATVSPSCLHPCAGPPPAPHWPLHSRRPKRGRLHGLRRQRRTHLTGCHRDRQTRIPLRRDHRGPSGPENRRWSRPTACSSVPWAASTNTGMQWNANTPASATAGVPAPRASSPSRPPLPLSPPNPSA